MAAHAPNTSSVARSAGASHQAPGRYERRLSGKPYTLVRALVGVGAGLLLLEGFVFWYGGVSYFSLYTFLCVAAAVVAIVFRSSPVLISVLLSMAAAGVVVIGGFNLADTTSLGTSTCSDELTAAIARVPDSYWTTWIVVGAATGAAMVAGSLLTPRAVGAGLLAVGGSALAIGTLVLWTLLNSELKSAPASFPVGLCGQPLGLGGAFILALPVALFALAAVIAAVWSKPFDRAKLNESQLDEERGHMDKLERASRHFS